MRQESESGRVPTQAKHAWIAVLACIATMGLAPVTALAQVPGETAIDDADEADEAEPGDKAPVMAAEDTAIDDADEADVMPGADDEVTQEDLDEAQANIDKAQATLDEAKRQLAMRIPEQPVSQPGIGVGLESVDGRAKKLQISLNEDGTLYLRFAMWLQVWARAIQLNPGTTVLSKNDAWYGDVALRRARFLMFGKIFPRTFMLMHIGINNQPFRRTRARVPVLDSDGNPTGDTVLEPVGVTRKPQLFFHDAWAEFEASKKGYIDIGAGLLYWNGISRMTNASTITAMSLDLPIINWPLIEVTDQFARQLGVYAKGKAGLFDWRVAAVRPFTPSAPVGSRPGNYNTDANTFGYAGYFQFQFLDIEPNVLPYTVGTYIGAKKVFNFGFGGYAQPIGIAYLDAADPTLVRKRALVIASGDLFLDIPFKAEKGGAATWYGVYYYQDFGPNTVRTGGIMNPADAPYLGTATGSGNTYPLIGTGHHVYSELGILMPGTVGESIQFQPYVNSQMSSFEGLNEGMFHFGAGLNMFIHRHNAKVTLEYRNRPIFDSATGNVQNRKGNSFILQMHLFI